MFPILVLAALLVWRELAHDRQVQSLLDRIQAPERVLDQRSPDISDKPLYVSPDDDEAYQDFVNARTAGDVV